MRMNKKSIIIFCMAALMCSCAAEFNNVYKSPDNDYKYEFAKQCFAEGKFQQAISLLQDVVTFRKGTDTAEESLYLLALSQYCNHDFEAASATFKKYYATYPKGVFAEQAAFNVGQSLYESTPEPRLDQTPTVGAINAYQQFLDVFPDSKLRAEAQQRLFDLQDNLVKKEYLSAELYYNLGGYFGNINANTESNYEACIITAQNALKTYPYTKLREEFAVLIMRSKFDLAENSSEEKKLERYRDAEDECYGFLNEYPDSKEASRANKYIAKCKKITGD